MAGECAADQLLGDRYALVEVLGHGASGVVWRARDQLLQRDVAVKEIRFPLVVGDAEDAAFREAILREARAAARLNHSGAVTVYDVVEDDGRPLIVMELVDAPTLAELVEAGRAAGAGARWPPSASSCSTPSTPATRPGIVHRDVKPRNVMVADSGRVRLADFGVAAVLDDARMTSRERGDRVARLHGPRAGDGRGDRARRPTSGRWAPRCTSRSRDGRPSTRARPSPP